MSEQPTNEEQQKAIVPIGPNGLEFRDMESLFRFAKAVELSGLAPKGLEKKEAIFIALCMAIELRMSPMAALQNIAVINGRPGIYGDAALALVRASGACEQYSQELVGEADQRKAVVRSTRGGIEIVSEFGVGDAKRAGLWGKAGPWSQYPDRMMIFRARGFNLRDNFGDVLKGFRTTEELGDMPDEKPANAIEIKRPELPSRPKHATSEPAKTEESKTDHTDPPMPAPATAKDFDNLKTAVRNARSQTIPPPVQTTMMPMNEKIETTQNPATATRERLSKTTYTESDFMSVLRKNALATKEQSIDQVSNANLQTVLDDWDTALEQMQANAV